LAGCAHAHQADRRPADGQQVPYLNWDDGQMKAARFVAMKDRRVTLLGETSRTHFTLPYGAIQTTPSSGPENGSAAPVPARPTPPPDIASRADFRVGSRVSFTDQHLQHRVGLIVRINQRTATRDCDAQTWPSMAVLVGRRRRVVVPVVSTLARRAAWLPFPSLRVAQCCCWA